jgi:hypothetical protein
MTTVYPEKKKEKNKTTGRRSVILGTFLRCSDTSRPQQARNTTVYSLIPLEIHDKSRIGLRFVFSLGRFLSPFCIEPGPARSFVLLA